VSAVKFLLKGVKYTETETDLTSLAWIAILSIGSILYSYIWSIVSLIRLKYKGGSLDNSKILLMSKVLSDSPLDKLLFESYIDSRPLLLSLNSRKIYVGTINSLGEPNESEGMDQEISVIPLISGYRDKDTLKVVLTTYYDAVDKGLNIVIRQEEVLSAFWFDFDIYKKLNSKKLIITNLMDYVSGRNTG
jgi:hypothetical protein